jgi:hypothetical protein
MNYSNLTCANNDFYCDTCKVTISIQSKRKHLKSKAHQAGVVKGEEKLRCACGGVYFSALFHFHEQTDIHKAYIRKREEENRKREEYDLSKDSKRCCSSCLKIDIPKTDYNEDLKLCKTCEKISRNEEKTCPICKKTKNISEFEKPRLLRCKKCASIKILSYVNRKI